MKSAEIILLSILQHQCQKVMAVVGRGVFVILNVVAVILTVLTQNDDINVKYLIFVIKNLHSSI